MSMHRDPDQVVAGWRSGARLGRFAVRAGIALAALASLPGCTSQQTTGESAAYLRIDTLFGASGAEPAKFSGVLASDVLTRGGVFADNGQVTVRTVMKDPGAAENPNLPSSTNLITLNRYRVRFLRSDGRNQQGVDVPHEFDGAMTFTALASGATGDFTLVRVQAKVEAPLMALRNLGGALAISTVAEVTFYGRDQAGRQASVSGTIGVNFADWADPESGTDGGNQGVLM